MKKELILDYLTSIKPIYEKEGFIIKGLFGSYSRDEETEESDVDIIVEATPKFAELYGFSAFKRIDEIKHEMSSQMGVSVDLADCTGMGHTGKQFIINRAVYV